MNIQKSWVSRLNLFSKVYIVCPLKTYAIYIDPSSVHVLYPASIIDGLSNILKVELENIIGNDCKKRYLNPVMVHSKLNFPSNAVRYFPEGSMAIDLDSLVKLPDISPYSFRFKIRTGIVEDGSLFVFHSPFIM